MREKKKSYTKTISHGPIIWQQLISIFYNMPALFSTVYLNEK